MQTMLDKQQTMLDKQEIEETMIRVPRVLAFYVALATVILSFGANRMHAQDAQTPPAAQEPGKTPEADKDKDKEKDKEKEEEDPFAPEPPPTLPPGMTGADINDPRAKLTPGLFDAGEAAMGIKHLMLLKKPDAFQLGI